MLFSLLKHYFHTDTVLKVSQSVYWFTSSISHGVENYFPRLGTGISDAILIKKAIVILQLHIFSLLINAVILLLNGFVFVLYVYIHFLSLGCYFLFLNIIWTCI